ncbi:MAG: aminodeoxychorismate synthase component I [Bacteroidetes bacterium]|nr:aminodeoxychorismate synthase component I [Bacteroidota bacterium]
MLDNNESINALNLTDIECIIAAGVKTDIKGAGIGDWNLLNNVIKSNEPDYLFGYLSYDLKNQIEKLESNHLNQIGLDELYFFKPIHLIIIYRNGSYLLQSPQSNLIEEILQTDAKHFASHQVQIKPKVSREKYIKNVQAIQQHIIEGDVYELNYCVEFFDEHARLDAYHVYQKLKQFSPTPFGAFLRVYDNFILCASPERFLKKKGKTLYSQPIKGTIKRGNSKDEDQQLILQLLNSEKERAENLMIVDLVRNDLARSSEIGSVKVEELFSIYTFSQVHQMISTVSSKINENTSAVEAIKNAFPMGSMTGAPKVMAMELIEKYETTKRGLYSGAIGYFAPNKDFDFNVVIRSIQYNANKKYVSFEVGSAITFDSNAEHEYEECLLKAQAMMRALAE